MKMKRLKKLWPTQIWKQSLLEGQGKFESALSYMDLKIRLQNFEKRGLNDLGLLTLPCNFWSDISR